MPSVYQPRRPRASPLWQIVHHAWGEFLARYESRHRKSLGPLRYQTVSTVEAFLRCGDLAAGFTRLQCLRDHFRTRLGLPEGKLGAIAAVRTFGDYLIFHPHLHVLASDGLFARDGTFHCMPAEYVGPAIELFRHRFLHALLKAKLISPKKLSHLLGWKHYGFSIHHDGEQPIPAHDNAGRRLTVRSLNENRVRRSLFTRLPPEDHLERHYNTKRNFEIFKAPDFIAAALLHLPPKSQQTVRYYGLYSNKSQPPFPRPPVRLRGLPQKQNPSSQVIDGH